MEKLALLIDPLSLWRSFGWRISVTTSRLHWLMTRDSCVPLFRSETPNICSWHVTSPTYAKVVDCIWTTRSSLYNSDKRLNGRSPYMGSFLDGDRFWFLNNSNMSFKYKFGLYGDRFSADAYFMILSNVDFINTDPYCLLEKPVSSVHYFISSWRFFQRNWLHEHENEIVNELHNNIEMR